MAVDIIARAMAAGNGEEGSKVLKYKGSCLFANLPTDDMEQGEVWDILDKFKLEGKTYPAGTNIAWTGAKWDPLGGSVDLSNYLAKNNTDLFTPTNDYNPATKKYVDEQIDGKTILLGNIKDYVSEENPLNLSDMEVGRYLFTLEKIIGAVNSFFKIVVNGVEYGAWVQMTRPNASGVAILNIYKKPSEANVGETFAYLTCPIYDYNYEGHSIGWNEVTFKRYDTYLLVSINREKKLFGALNYATNVTEKWTFKKGIASNVEPTSDTDVTTKKYVDDAIASIPEGGDTSVIDYVIDARKQSWSAKYQSSTGQGFSDSNGRAILNQIIKAHNEGYKHSVLLTPMRSTSGGLVYCPEMRLSADITEIFNNKPTSIQFIGDAFTFANSTGQKSSVGFSHITIIIKWEDDTPVIDQTKSHQFWYTQTPFLPTDNNGAYTPTSNYHPATKKYVDDQITARIAQSLEASY